MQKKSMSNLQRKRKRKVQEKKAVRFRERRASSTRVWVIHIQLLLCCPSENYFARYNWLLEWFLDIGVIQCNILQQGMIIIKENIVVPLVLEHLFDNNVSE